MLRFFFNMLEKNLVMVWIVWRSVHSCKSSRGQVSVFDGTVFTVFCAVFSAFCTEFSVQTLFSVLGALNSVTVTI